jgi:glycosyltransferase involved in cell wall biosynthesis
VKGPAATTIRPLMVSLYFDPIYSGSAIQAFNLATALRRRGAEPIIVSANLSGSPAHELYHGIPLYRVPVLKGSDTLRVSFWASFLALLVRLRGRFDVIHAHGTGPHAIVGPAGWLFRTPTILKIAMAGSDINFRGMGRLLGRTTRAMVRPIDRYIATTEAIAAEFAAAGLDAGRVRLIPNGVDTETNRPLDPQAKAALRRELQLPDGPLAITVGIVISRKNVDGALRAFAAAAGRGAPGHFLVLGPMPAEHAAYHDSLRAMIRTHNLGARVTFLGYRTPVAPYLQAADVFVFPSRQEGMPNSVLEAMACGLPCLVSQSAGVEASVVTHGTSGFALDVADEASWADTLQRLLCEPELRARIGEGARQAIEARFSLDAIATRYWQLYHELLDRPAPDAVAAGRAPHSTR